MKKALIISGTVILLVFAVLLSAPFLFKDKIEQAVLTQANNNLNATIGFKNIRLSFIRNFPNASIVLQDFYIVGKAPFETDTLLFVKEASAVIDLRSLFADTGYDVKRVFLENPSVFAHVLKDGRVNWDISIPDTAVVADSTQTTSAFRLKLQQLTIENGSIKYIDEQANISFLLQNLNHSLSGDLTAETTLLQTSTTAGALTLEMDNIAYLKKATALLNADIKADLKNMVFTFSDNKSSINAIEFELNGWVKMLENGYDMDIKLNAPGTDFKQILSMIPAIYAKNFESIETKGNVTLDGVVKGLYTDSLFPSFLVNMLVTDAWFKYPALPKSVDDINISATISNPGGLLDYTKIQVENFAFVLGGNPFTGTVSVATPVSDPDIDFFAKGKLNLGMIKEVYPLDSGMELTGIVDADLKLKGKMSYYDKEQYEKFFFDGGLKLADMVIKTTSLPHVVEIKKAELDFNPKFVNLPVFQLKIGKSDLSGSGKLENFIPFVLRNEILKGNLQTQSVYLNVADLMTDTVALETATNKDTTAMAIVALPANLNFSLNSSFKKIIFGTIVIDNAKGSLLLADSKLSFKDISLQTMGGTVLMNGEYNTQNLSNPLVDIDFKMNNVLFSELFTQVETIQKLAPIFAKTSGRLTTNLTLKTKLGNDMMPDINTLYSKGLLVSDNLAIKDVKVLNNLGTVLNRDELKNPELDRVSVPFEIKDGRVFTDPFAMTVGETTINMDKGSTGIDQTIDYTMKLEIPTPESTLIKLNKIGVRLGGSFSKPTVKIETREMLKDVAATLKSQTKETMDEVKVVAKEQITEIKEQLKEGIAPELKEAGQNIKEGGKKIIKGIFKKDDSK